MVTKRSVVTTIFTFDLKVKSLTRAWLGMGVWTPPLLSFFFAIAQKTAARSATAFDTAIQTIFPTCCESFDSGLKVLTTSGQVIKSGQMTHPKTKFPIASRQWWRRERLKLSGFSIPPSAYNLYISYFLYRSPRVRSISWPSHCKSMGKTEIHKKNSSDLFYSFQTKLS